MTTDVRLDIETRRRGERVIGGIQRDFRGLETTIGRVSRAARSFVGLFAGAAIARGLGGLIRTDDNVSKLARSLGIATEEVSKLNFAAERSGVSQRALETGLRTVIGAGADAAEGIKTYADAFAALQIDASLFNRLPITEKIEALADAFNSLPDGANRQDLALTLFGRRGGLAFLNLLDEGSTGLRELYGEAERFGVTTAEAGQKAEDAADALTNLETSGSNLGRRLGGTLLPFVTEATNALAELGALLPDIEVSFDSIGRSIGRFAAVISDPDAAKLIPELRDPIAAAADEAEELVDQAVQVTTTVAAQTPVIEANTEAINNNTAAKQANAAAGSAFQRVRTETPDLGEQFTIGLPVPGAQEALQQIATFGKEDYTDQVQELSSILSIGIESGVRDGTEGALDVFRDFISRALAEFAASGLVNLLGIGAGGGGGGLFGVLGGALGFATGTASVPGPTGAPRLAIVHGGEEIIPNNRTRGGGGMNITVNAPGATPGTVPQIRAAVAEAVARSEAIRRDSQRRGRG